MPHTFNCTTKVDRLAVACLADHEQDVFTKFFIKMF